MRGPEEAQKPKEWGWLNRGEGAIPPQCAIVVQQQQELSPLPTAFHHSRKEVNGCASIVP